MSDNVAKFDITLYTLEDFLSMGIGELRDVAAWLEVPSPTTYPKNELAELTYMAKCGRLPIVKKYGRGRPTKASKYTYALDRDNMPEKDMEGEFPAYKGTALKLGENLMPFNFNLELNDLMEIAHDNGYENTEAMQDLMKGNDYMNLEGSLDILPDGYGFLRIKACECSQKDTYVNSKIIKFLGLRKGDYIIGVGRKMYDNRPAALQVVTSVNGKNVRELKFRNNFESMTPIYPNKKIMLEKNSGRTDVALRCIDLISPIGKGQRALIVAPPKAGKTTLLKKIANAISESNPEIYTYILLIDERPEEVTDIRRSTTAEVYASTFDENPEHHIKMADYVIEAAKRKVESGLDVVIIMDSLTRLARACNITSEGTGRSLSGGLMPNALDFPKKFFGTARNFEKGGSLTIIATALVETGSRLDDIIYEEFKGTGNMEVFLDKTLSEKRVFPAIDIYKSGTRHEELLLDSVELQVVNGVRRLLYNKVESTENLISMLYKTSNNQEFLEKMNEQYKLLEVKG